MRNYLDGLTIKNATDGGAVNIGQDCLVKLIRCGFRDNTNACIYNVGTTTLTDCLFLSNSSVGVSNNGTATLMGCTFTGNSGGGVNNNGTATLTGCTFNNNTNIGSGGGGGGFANIGTATLTGCTFSGNSTSYGGGGGLYNQGTLTLSSCIFSGNNSGRLGGGGIDTGGMATLTSCTFTNNTCNGDSADGNGGGVSNHGRVLLTNCIISGNATSAGNRGGVFNDNQGQAIIRFCSISGNIAKGNAIDALPHQGGGLENDGIVILTDDVIWGNTAANAPEIGTPANGNQTTTVTYCNIQGGVSGAGNIKANPLFISTAITIMPPLAVTNMVNADMHLQAGSPCRGAGIAIPPSKPDPNNPNVKPDPGVLTDADGLKRPNPPSIGAYEYSANPPKPKKILLLDLNSKAAPDAAADVTAGVGTIAPDTAASPAVPATTPTTADAALPAATAPTGPRPKLWPAEQKQENAAFLQLMATLNTNHYTVSDMAQKIQAELDKGADINAKDSEGFPAIVTAASLSHTDVVQVLIEKGADVNLTTDQAAKGSATDSSSILHKTANGGYQVDIGGAIAGLFAKKPKPLFGQTALMLAAQSGQTDLVTLLLTHKADIHLKDSRGKTALDYAAQNHQDNIVQVLKAQDSQ